MLKAGFRRFRSREKKEGQYAEVPINCCSLQFFRLQSGLHGSVVAAKLSVVGFSFRLSTLFAQNVWMICGKVEGFKGFGNQNLSPNVETLTSLDGCSKLPKEHINQTFASEFCLVAAMLT